MTTARLGLLLGLGRANDGRSRPFVLLLVGALVAFLWLNGASLLNALGSAQERKAARSPSPAADLATAAFRTAFTSDLIPGDPFGPQIMVIWLEDLGVGGALPPGLDRASFDDHRFAVSPGLADELNRQGIDRYSPYTIIGDAGVSDQDELLAYGWAPAGSLIRGSPTSGFGRPPSDRWSGPVREWEAILGIGIFLVAPGLILLLAATLTQTRSRIYRFQLLARIGASRRQLLVMGATETAVPVLGGFAVGAAAHALWALRTERFPFLGLAVNSGDLVVPPDQVAALVAAGAVSAALLGLATAWSQSRIGKTSRPEAVESRPSAWRFFPTIAGLAMMLVGVQIPRSSTASVLVISGTLFVVAGMPLALPVLAGAIGDVLSRRNGITALLIGRRLQSDARSVTGPLLLFSLALVLAGFIVGVAVTLQPESGTPRQAPIYSVALQYPTATVDVRALSTPEVTFIPSRSSFGGSVVTLDTTCAELTTLGFGDDVCLAEGFLTPEGSQRLIDSAGGYPLFNLGPTGPDPFEMVAFGSAVNYEVFVSNVADITQPTMVGALARPVRPWANSNDGGLWVAAGMRFVTLLAVFGTAVVTGERYGVAIDKSKILGILGLSRQAHWRLEVVQFTMIFAVTTIVALLIGTLGAWFYVVAAGATYPLGAGTGLVVRSLAFGLVLIATVGTAAWWRIRRDDMYSLATDRDAARWS